MARALIYVLSGDSEVRLRVKQIADFIFFVFDTAAELDAALERRKPDLYLIDFDLPDLLCENYQPALGLAMEQATIPHEKVLGFLLKDSSADIFRAWLLRHEQLLEEKLALERQLNESFKTAMTAMSSMGEIGVAMRFLTDAFNICDYNGLCERMVGALEDYGLSGAAQIRVPGETYMVSRAQSQYDSDVFAQMRDLGRILEFKNRMIVNYEHVSILVRDMPADDGARGRMRDNIAILAEGGHARVASLLLQSDNTNKQKGIQRALAEIRDTVMEIRERNLSDPRGMHSLIGRAIDQTQCSFIHLNLKTAQENMILEPLLLLRDGYDAERGAFNIDARLSMILSTLESISNS